MNKIKYNKDNHRNTELGWIPEDWTSPKLDEVFTFLNNASFTREQLNYNDVESVQYIHYGDIHATYRKQILDFEIENRIPKLNENILIPRNIDFLNDGDVIIADASEDYEGVGEATEIYNLKNLKAISGLHTFAIRDRGNSTAKGFRSYIFKNPTVKNSLKILATGSKVYGISKKNLAKLKLALPSLPEQQKIAQILSTWDKAIAQQEQLIAQKKQLKKGMMQQLLTAKLRFPGFVGEWEMVKMGTICKLQGGYAFESSQYKKNGIPIIRISNISNKNNYIELKEVIYYEKIENDSNFILKNGDLLIAMSGATIGKSSIYNLNEIGYLNQRVGKFNPVGSKIDYQFLIQFVFSNKFKEK
jgi:type I restriction enzyme S subunit